MHTHNIITLCATSYHHNDIVDEKMQFHIHLPPDKVHQQAFAKTAVCQQILQD